MRFLVTGAAGFIGSNLVRMLLRQYPESQVLSYDLLTYAGSLANLADVQDETRHEFVKGDIGDGALLSEILARFQPNVIFHLAAETHVDRSIQSSDPFVEANVVGHTRMLETVYLYFKKLYEKDQQRFKFIHVSTDEVFGSLRLSDAAFDESTAYNPLSPYAASKAAGDHMVRAWGNTYGLPTVNINCSNNYGPYQFPEKLIPFMIMRALGGESLPVYGDGKNVRDWLYVEDHCAALIAASEKGKIGETYCVGGESERSNLQVVEMVCNALDEVKPRVEGRTYKEQVEFVADRPGHDFRYAINCSKAKADLEWMPVTSFEEGLKHTLAWYLHNVQWLDDIRSDEYRQWISAHYKVKGSV
ncbi:MAG: dTDP-glucose 4,6-dehydratase [Micavibrio sp.]|nr:dTDP-glucose 4,6-dehydratase [Micavibrio sp.]